MKKPSVEQSLAALRADLEEARTHYDTDRKFSQWRALGAVCGFIVNTFGPDLTHPLLTLRTDIDPFRKDMGQILKDATCVAAIKTCLARDDQVKGAIGLVHKALGETVSEPQLRQLWNNIQRKRLTGGNALVRVLSDQLYNSRPAGTADEQVEFMLEQVRKLAVRGRVHGLLRDTKGHTL